MRGMVSRAFILVALLLAYVHGQLPVTYGAISTGAKSNSSATLVSFNNPSGVLISETAISAVEPTRFGRIFVDQRGARTALAVTNPTNETIQADLTLRDSSGNEVDKRDQRLSPHESLVLFVDELFPDLAQGFTGSLTFVTAQSDQKLAGVALHGRRNAQGESVFSALPVVDVSAAQEIAGSIVVPLVSADVGFSTQLVLVNRTERRIRGLIQLRASDGGPLGLAGISRLAYEIEPNGVYHTEFGNSSEARVGYAVITPDPGDAIPWSSAILQFRADGQVLSEGGVEASLPTVASRTFVDNTSGRTGLAVANPNEHATRLTFNLMDGNGVPVNFTTRDLPAGAHLSIFVDELFTGLHEKFVGFIEITSSLPVAPMAAKVTTNVRGEPILAVLPVADLTRHVEARPLVLPQVGLSTSRLSTQQISLDGHGAGALVETLGVMALDATAPCAVPIQNPILCENSKPGNSGSEWNISGLPDPDIQGYASDISINRGETVYFKVKTVSGNYRLDIYRLGYYSGLGARKIATITPSASLPQSQPSCLTDSTTGLIDCGNWAVSASWAVPSDAVSGVYLAKLVRQDGITGASHVVFIVRDDSSQSDILFQTSDTTWHAYNGYGGNSLYGGSPAGRAYKVSYNRPFSDNVAVLVWEYPMIRFLEANGYNVSYFTGVDSDRRGLEIREHKIFLSVGHDEYWSSGQRSNVEDARNAGVHLAFFSGNEVYWKTRWENSIDGSNTPYRTLVCYKETHAGAKIDPNPAWTGTWRDPRFSPPADGGRPENALTGTLFMVNGTRSDAITVSEAYSRMRLWRNTSIASLLPGQTAIFPTGTLGYEWDVAPDNGFSPPGLVKFSSTTINVTPLYLQDYGTHYGDGIATHQLTLYKHASGALVFGAGTIQWSWGLDGTNADARMRQATVNLLADMGVQPGSLQPGLVTTTASSDSIAPTSQITSPPIQGGAAGLITGTAADSGGGVVGGVEVSVDGGLTWHPANGRENWSYSWWPDAAGSFTIKSRAVDDSGNLESPGAGVAITVTCPCTLKYEAENATIVGAVVSNIDPGFTGTGFVDYQNSTGDYIEWAISVPSAGVYPLDFRYANGSTANRPLALRVNQTVVDNSLSFPATASWATWSIAEMSVSLNAGVNTIRLTTAGSSGPNIDSLTINVAAAGTPTLAAPANLTANSVSSSQINLTWTDNANNESGFKIERSTDSSNFTEVATVGANVTSFSSTGLNASTTYYFRVRAFNGDGNSAYSNTASATTATGTSTGTYQAENATIVGAVVSNSDPGFTGTGYVDYQNSTGDYIEWTISVPSAGAYALDFRYANGSAANRPLSLSVNQTVVNNSLSFPATASWATWGIVEMSVSLNAGVNTIRLTAVGSSGANIDSLIINATSTPTPAPTAPANLTANSVSSSQINLTWTDNASNESGFKIERSTDSSNFTEVATVGANVTSFSSTGLNASSTYYFCVRTFNGDGTSADSNTASATTATGTSTGTYEAENATIVGAVVSNSDPGFTGTGFVDYQNSTGDYIEWTINVPSAGAYALDFRYANASTANRPLALSVNQTVVNNSLSFPATGSWATWSIAGMSVSLNAGINTIRLTAAGSSGANIDSLIINATSTPTPAPTAPANLTANSVSSSQINLTWTDNANNESGFKIERSTDSSNFTEVATVGANVTSFSSTGLNASTTYYFRVRAFNGGGNSAYSNTASATTATGTSTGTYQAENATIVGAVVSNSDPGFTGTGFVDYQNSTGDYIEWTISVPSTGAYALDFRYANGGTGDRPLALSVNQTVVNNSLSFPATGSWTTWSIAGMSVSLNAGVNTIRLTAAGSSGPNIDSLTIR